MLLPGSEPAPAPLGLEVQSAAAELPFPGAPTAASVKEGRAPGQL